MICTACGQGLPQGALFCPYCGAAAPIPAPAQGGTAAGRAANAPCEAAPPAAPGEATGVPAPEEAPAGAPKAPAPPDAPGACPPAHSAQAEEENGPGQAAQAQNGACEGPADGPQPGMRVRDYFWCLVLFCIPVAGLVPMVAWAFSERVCEEKRRLSRAALCLAGIVLAAVLLALALAAGAVLIFFTAGAVRRLTAAAQTAAARR